MSDRAALYAAICEHPDEDTPRLALADWLDEHGRPDRAALIRCQVQADREGEDVTPGAAVREFLDGLTDGSDAAVDWTAVDPGIARKPAGRHHRRNRLTLRAEGVPRLAGLTVRNTARRGFLYSAVARDGAAFLRHAAALFRAAPIEQVTFESLTAEEARDLARSGHLRRVRELWLPDGVEPAAVRALGTHPDAAGVRALFLSELDDATGVLAGLAAGRHWTGLRELWVTGCPGSVEPITGAVLARLFRNRALRGLTRLNLSDNILGDEEASALARAGLDRLRALNLSCNTIGAYGAQALAQSRSLGALRLLNLEYNSIGSAAAAAHLIASPRLASLTALHLGGNDFTGLDAGVLAGRRCRPPVLRALGLEGNRLGVGGVEALAGCRSAAGLWVLSLRGCGVTANAVRALAKAADWRELAWLNLSHNQVAGPAAAALAGWPALASLRGLRIDHNRLGPAGARALVDSPHLGRLEHLAVRKQDVGAAAGRLKRRFGRALRWVTTEW